MTAFGRYDCNLLLFGDFSRLIWLVLFLEIRLSELAPSKIKEQSRPTF